MARAASLGRHAATAALLLSAAASLFPLREPILALDHAKLLPQPYAWIGFSDLLLALFLALGVTSCYPLIRFRAAAGLGLVGFTFYAQGYGLDLTFVTGGCVGLFLSTIVVRMRPAIIAAALAVGGMGLLAWSVFGGQ
jgi:hypothetical protein